MEVEMEASPSSSFFDPEDLSTRAQFRRYGKRSAASMSPQIDTSAFKLSDGRMNPTLLLEDIKQEVESLSYRERTPFRSHSSYKKQSPDGDEFSPAGIKIEYDELLDDGETTFSLFASLLEFALQGSTSFADLILQFEESCRNISESIRYGPDGTEEIPEDLTLSPATSHLLACQFVATDLTAQLCLRIVQWLEGLASKALDLENKVRGSHVGTYLPSSGIWHYTQRHLQKRSRNQDTICHLDFDAPTRENALPLIDDRKQDECVLEDVWTLLRAGRLEEACDLCTSSGQSWRAASLCPFGGLDLIPSIEALQKNGQNRTLQAVELESGVGRQWHLWKWASYCASERIAAQEDGKYEAAVYAALCSNLKRMLLVCTDWESACWAITKSWLDVQVDLELVRLRSGGLDQLKGFEDAIEWSPKQGGSASQLGSPDNWPLQILNQQPRAVSSLLQKLHSGELVHEAVAQGCKEQHRQIQMNLMLGDVQRLLELLWSWISPSEDNQDIYRHHGEPQMIRFGAHLVLVLRHLFGDQVNDIFKETITNVGDLILQMYVMFLFSKQHEDLVGIYASQLAHHRCIDLFVHMMELRLNASVHVKYKLFTSAMEHLPFSPDDDDSRGSIEEIMERVLSRSRDAKLVKNDKSSDVLEQHRLQSLEKAMVIQWLCFSPPSVTDDEEAVSAKLLLLALMHSNILFREFALMSMWRIPRMPIGAHKLLSFLAEPLKQPPENLLSFEEHDVSDYLKEFKDWSEFYSCDATYRNWLNIELESSEVSPLDLSLEERQRAITTAEETISSALSVLQRKENFWLLPTEDRRYENTEVPEPVFIELHATAILCLSSGECISPDATLCATLMSALCSSVTEEVVSNRQLMVNVVVSSKDSNCIEVVLRCLATEGDGLGPHELGDGGILAAALAAGFKGELARFQAGVTMDISRLDAWYSDSEGSIEGPATYIVRGLCRRCCLPELILRCMQVSVSLVEMGKLPERHDELIKLVACPETGFLHLFTQQQLQEFLLFEREYSIQAMGQQEGAS
ncbi:Nuclear pore complex protein NUP107-like protein [Drosera capensis]